MPSRDAIRIAQSSFVAGEFSPRLASRSDIALYRNGAALLTNRRPRATGGNDTRPGLRRLATLADAPARLRPFVFSESQRYPLAFSDARVDPFLPDGTPCTPVTGAPWTAAMLERLVAVPSGDTVLLFHPDMPPQRLVRTGATTFALSALAFESDSTGRLRIPFERFAAPGITLTPSATTGAITLTASAAAFDPLHVGVRFRLGGKQVTITAVGSATSASATVVEALASTSATAEWDEQAFGALRGWPVSGAFIDNRLILGGSRAKPTGVWFSKVGAFFNFDLGTALDGDAIWESITGGRITQVRHVFAAERLLVLGDSGVWFVPASASAPITPGNIAFRQVSDAGAAWAPPVRVDLGVQYLDITGGVVRELVWNEGVDSYTADAVSLAAEHLVVSPSEATAYDGSGEVPERLGFWCCADGTLAVFHSIRAEKIGAWYRWVTDGEVESVAAVGSEVFAVVRRVIAGTPRRFLEKFVEAPAAPLDCAARATSGSPTRDFAGFAHLAGQAVEVYSQGHDLGSVLVASDGSITLGEDRPAVTELEAGLYYEQRLRPMPVDADIEGGPARGLMKRLIRTIIQVDRSAAFTVQGRDVLLRFAGDDFATPAPTATGLIEVRLLGHSREAQFDIVVPRPAHVTVLGLTREVRING